MALTVGGRALGCKAGSCFDHVHLLSLPKNIYNVFSQLTSNCLASFVLFVSGSSSRSSS